MKTYKRLITGYIILQTIIPLIITIQACILLSMTIGYNHEIQNQTNQNLVITQIFLNVYPPIDELYVSLDPLTKIITFPFLILGIIMLMAHHIMSITSYQIGYYIISYIPEQIIHPTINTLSALIIPETALIMSITLIWILNEKWLQDKIKYIDTAILHTGIKITTIILRIK